MLYLMLTEICTKPLNQDQNTHMKAPVVSKKALVKKAYLDCNSDNDHVQGFL